MNIITIQNSFNNLIPQELTNELIQSYNKALNEYSKQNWKYLINELAQFNEITYRIIEFLLTGLYTPIKDKLPNASIAFRKADSKLAKEFSNAILELKSSPEYAKLVKKYFPEHYDNFVASQKKK